MQCLTPKFINTIARLLLVCLGFMAFTGCKKGEEDPNFSFQTRKQRLVGEWKMTSGKVSFTQSNYSELFTFDGTELKLFTTYTGGPPVYYVGKYSLSLKITKQGDMSFSEILVGKVLEGQGNWAFGKGKGEYENKEQVMFNLKDVLKGQSWNGLFNYSNSAFCYNLKKLDREEMHLYSSGLFYTRNNAQVSYTAEYTFRIR